MSKGSADDDKFKILFESAPDAIYLCDNEGNFVDGNKAAEKLMGCKRGELIGKSFLKLKLLPKEQIPKAAKSLAKNARGKPTGPDEYTLNRKDGTQIIVEIRTFPIKVEGKNLLLGIARDITKRKEVEDELRGIKQMLENITQGMGDGILILSTDFKIEWANNAALKETGHTIKEIRGKHCYKVTHRLEKPCGPPKDICPVVEVTKTGKPVTALHTHFDKRGNEKFVEVSAHPIKDEKGKITQYVHITRDITERKKAEDELRRSAIYLDAMPDVLCVTSPDGKIIKVNQTFYDFWGYSPEEVIGRPALDMFLEGEKAKLKKEAKTAMKTGKSRHFETFALTKHGAEIPVSLSEMALKDEQGKAAAIVTVLKDITITKKAESALKQAYEEVKSIDELKSDIIANVTHELRTPVTIVRGAIEMAAQEKNPDEREALLKMATEALMRQNSIIGDLVSATKIEKERKHEIEAVDLSTIIPFVINEFNGLLIKNKLDLKIDLNKNLPSVMADLEGLSHILRNLISNAIKFNKVGGMVTITAGEKGGFVEVCVSDTGIGISKDVHERVFERFYQADSSAVRTYAGIGLGLTIVKEAVELLGGEIQVKSQVGKGSTFCFTLPKA